MPRSFHRKIAILGALENAMNYAFDLPGDANGTETLMWPFQEPPGYIGNSAVARNDALALGRDILVPNKDFTDGWIGAGDVTIDDADSFTMNDGLPGGIYKDIGLATGKSYQLIVAGDTASGTFEIRNGPGGASPLIGTGFGTHTFTAVDARLYFRVIGAGTTNITMPSTTVKQTDIAAWEAFPGAELLVDGDMEAATTAAWGLSGSPTLTKEAGTRTGGSGTKVLRVAVTVANEGATQTILTVGKRYRVTGWARTNGSTTCSFIDSGAGIVLVIPNSATWQFFDEEWVAKGTTVRLRTSSVGQYSEWDDVSITEANPLNGGITGATVGQPTTLRGIPYGYSFDAVNDYINIASKELNSFFNPLAGTLGFFGLSDTWAVGLDSAIALAVDADNLLLVSRSATNLVGLIVAGGITKTTVIPSGSPSGWWSLIMTWDTVADTLDVYLNGVRATPTLTGLGTWVGNFAATTQVISASTITPTLVWSGDLAAPFLSRFAWTPAQVLKYNQLVGLA